MLPSARWPNTHTPAAGRTAAHAQKVIDDAVALEDAGAVMLLIEAVPDDDEAAMWIADIRNRVSQ